MQGQESGKIGTGQEGFRNKRYGIFQGTTQGFQDMGWGVQNPWQRFQGMGRMGLGAQGTWRRAQGMRLGLWGLGIKMPWLGQAYQGQGLGWGAQRPGQSQNIGWTPWILSRLQQRQNEKAQEKGDTPVQNSKDSRVAIAAKGEGTKKRKQR